MAVDNVPVKTANAVTLAEFKGELCAFVQRMNSNMYDLYTFDDAGSWQLVGKAFESLGTSAALEHGGLLFVVFADISDRSLWAGAYSGNNWVYSGPVAQARSSGIPALFELKSKLYVAFATNDSSRSIVIYAYNDSTHSWFAAGSTGESTASGVCATSSNDQAFIGFQSNADSSGDLIVITCTETDTWSRVNDPYQSSTLTPVLAIYNGILNLVWDSHDFNRVVLWSQHRGLKHLTSSWMTDIADDTRLLSNLSIPGTHDSSAFNYAWPFVSTQTMPFVRQLDAGVRYFDLRCALSDNTVQMVHGSIYLGFDLPSVLTILYGFLDIHPREALIAQIKEDIPPRNSTIGFADAISSLISSGSKYWRTLDTTPTLGDVRGKIQLFRRYDMATNGYDINVYVGWLNNSPTPFHIRTSSGVNLFVQDYFDPDRTYMDAINVKVEAVENLAVTAYHDQNTANWYVNYTSAVQGSLGGLLITAKQFALGRWVWGQVQGVNGRIHDYMSNLPISRRRFGVFAMDYPESPNDDYLTTIIDSNFET